MFQLLKNLSGLVFLALSLNAALAQSGIDPMDRGRDARPADELSGDKPGPIHQVLWHKKQFIAALPGGKLPEATETVDIAVVGGGMSGLLSAYLLKSSQGSGPKITLFDLGDNLGGNSRGESWQGIDYSIAAAYISPPEAGSFIAGLLKDLGLEGKSVDHSGAADPIFINGKKYDSIWETGTGPQNKDQFNRLKKHFEDMVGNKNGLVYPELPIQDPSQKSYIHELDQQTMRQYLEKVLAAKLDPNVAFTIDRYLRSALVGTIDEISAAVGLNFFVGDFKGIRIFPGGNSAITQALVDQLRKDPKLNLQSGRLVFDVQADEAGVNVAAVDQQGKVTVTRAKNVVMACPKFVVDAIMPDLESERSTAIGRIDYRAYLVANVLLNEALPKNFYDLFYGIPAEDMSELPGLHFPAPADVVDANFAQGSTNRHVLTFYFPLAFDGGQRPLMQLQLDAFKKAFTEHLSTVIAPAVGLHMDKIESIRVARLGHPIPVARAGLIADGVAEKVSQPFGKHVFFVNQDNWILPSFEGIVSEARRAVELIRQQPAMTSCETPVKK